MGLLLIEDDLTIAAFVSKGLKKAGIVVEHARAGLHMALTSCYDAAVIDVMLPGWRVSRSLTSYGSGGSWLMRHDISTATHDAVLYEGKNWLLGGI